MLFPRTAAPADKTTLTPREREVLPYVALGRANKVIAIDLGISMRTVETHRARIFRKTGVRNAVELARWLYGGGGGIAATASGGGPALRLAEPEPGDRDGGGQDPNGDP